MSDDYMLHEAANTEHGGLLYALGTTYQRVDQELLEVTLPAHLMALSPTAPVSTAAEIMLAAGMRQGWDAAWPPAAPPDVEFVAGYIGGGTPHVWSDTEWATALARSSAPWRLPIFVRVPPTTRDPVAEANFSADWADDHGQPKGSLIALDYETAVNAAYLSAFDTQIVKRGYATIVYGSRSFVLQNPKPSGGYWTATWNNVPHLDAGAAMTQYGGDVTLGQPYDLNVASDEAHLWNTTGDDMSAADVKAINDHSDDLYRLVARDSDGRSNLALLNRKLDALAAVVKGEGDQTQEAIASLAALVGAGGVEAQTVADLVIAGVGPAVAKAAADEIHNRLAE